ncbi:MAG: hypothetical protein KDJ15_07140, partial [Alphaproteobacteria bacterium]|nr:hypothetical protein [Alphaproteobacteria bacterium]
MAIGLVRQPAQEAAPRPKGMTRQQLDERLEEMAEELRARQEARAQREAEIDADIDAAERKRAGAARHAAQNALEEAHLRRKAALIRAIAHAYGEEHGVDQRLFDDPYLDFIVARRQMEPEQGWEDTPAGQGVTFNSGDQIYHLTHDRVVCKGRFDPEAAFEMVFLFNADPDNAPPVEMVFKNCNNDGTVSDAPLPVDQRVLLYLACRHK